jgi:hypothetical protein
MMKKLAVLMGAASVAVLALQPQPAYAGDREWATAGKILTGVVVGQVLLNGILCPQRTVVVERPVVVGGCAPVAVYAPPVPGVYAPVVYSPPPVVYAPVVYSPPPVVYVPPVCTTRIVYSSGCYAPPPWYCYPSRGSSFSIHYHSGWHSSRHPHRHVRCR